ncbi:hypothetical protein WCD96_14530, partial [Proteus mirabilis]|uniref:hypothetical protein n=1 Tax=Proteus mirabilis TaxID=584 RepID=UPI0034D483FB
HSDNVEFNDNVYFSKEPIMDSLVINFITLMLHFHEINCIECHRKINLSKVMLSLISLDELFPTLS